MNEDLDVSDTLDQPVPFTLENTVNSETLEHIYDTDTLYIYRKHELEEAYYVPCDSADSRGYPEQEFDDYLNEWKFADTYHNVIFDHIVTRKMLNIFIPEINDSLRAVGITDTLTLCYVNIEIQHPVTGQVAVFHDIYNWVNDDLKPIFNLNMELHKLWGYKDAIIAFPINSTHMPTGRNMDFEHEYVTLNFNGL